MPQCNAATFSKLILPDFEISGSEAPRINLTASVRIGDPN